MNELINPELPKLRVFSVIVFYCYFYDIKRF